MTERRVVMLECHNSLFSCRILYINGAVHEAGVETELAASQREKYGQFASATGWQWQCFDLCLSVCLLEE